MLTCLRRYAIVWIELKNPALPRSFCLRAQVPTPFFLFHLFSSSFSPLRVFHRKLKFCGKPGAFFCILPQHSAETAGIPQKNRFVQLCTKRSLSDIDQNYLQIRSVPIYLRSTSGTVTEPSAFWYCSTMAGITRLVARPDALSVCTKCSFLSSPR